MAISGGFLYLVIIEILNLIWQSFDAIGQFLIVNNVQILKNNLTSGHTGRVLSKKAKSLPIVVVDLDIEKQMLMMMTLQV